MPRTDAIDVSAHRTATGPQGPLVAAVTKATEDRFTDSKFAQLIEHFRSQPHIEHVGAFHWLISTIPVTAQFDAFASAWDSIGGMRAGEFWIVDVEPTRYNGVLLPDPKPEQVEEFCRFAVAHFGPDRGLVYGNSAWSAFWQWRQRNRVFPLWYANANTDPGSQRYGLKIARQINAVAWQWGTPTDPVGGFAGQPVDASEILLRDWFDHLTPDTEDDMPTIYKSADGSFNAQFISVPDPRVPLAVRWSGPGDAPGVLPMLAGLPKLGATERTIALADLKGAFIIEDPAKIVDAKRKWSAADFAGVLPSLQMGGGGATGGKITGTFTGVIS